ncbi:hypothetical protein NIES4101_29580 [Calothrix sp. NIES-4101]|nr:hypothetical protein NIES4101_29580 [Calothrix sp. NIES-4101]
MSLPPLERELLYDEYWSLWQETKLPHHLELLANEQEIKRDIWEDKNPKPIYKLSRKILITNWLVNLKTYILG